MTNSTYTGEYDVAPFAGAWIEIVRAAWLPCGRLRSLPSRERGLKFYRDGCGLFKGKVAPFAGAWIEIGLEDGIYVVTEVAPFAGAWIEMPGNLRS